MRSQGAPLSISIRFRGVLVSLLLWNYSTPGWCRLILARLRRSGPQDAVIDDHRVGVKETKVPKRYGWLPTNQVPTKREDDSLSISLSLSVVYVEFLSHVYVLLDIYK